MTYDADLTSEDVDHSNTSNISKILVPFYHEVNEYMHESQEIGSFVKR